MTDNKIRHTFTPAQKAQAVRQHLLGKVPVSDLAEQLGTQPRQVHLWIEQVLASFSGMSCLRPAVSCCAFLPGAALSQG